LAFAADWSNPNPAAVGEKAGSILNKHESNMTDLYAGSSSRLNLLRSSFASASSPSTPNTGQSWYDSTNKYFEIYDAGWGGGGFYSAGSSTLASVYIGAGAIETLNVLTIVKTGTAVVPNLNADFVDGYHAGNNSGQVPVSNGTVNTNLNADLLDGQHGSYYLRPGTQNDVTGSRTLGTVYQNTTGFPMTASVVNQFSPGGEMTAYVGASNPPGTIVDYYYMYGPGGDGKGSVIFMDIMPGYYYKVVSTGGTLASWVEWY
jgi:hypothetical protein